MSEAHPARVKRALAGELPVEDLTAAESKLFDAEVNRQLAVSMATTDLTLPENRSDELVGGVSVDAEGRIVLTPPSGRAFVSNTRVEGDAAPEPMCSIDRVDGDLTIYTMFLEGTPVAVEAASFDEAATRFVEDLREYAADWTASPALQLSINHRDNRILVEAVEDMSEQELIEWARGERQLSCPP